MSVFNFALTLFGLMWFSAAVFYGLTLGDEWTFHMVLVFAHMGIGFGIAVTGLCRR